MDDMNQSIYTGYANFTPDEIQWLDGCGATWESGEIFSKYKMRYMQVVFNGRVFHRQSLGSGWQKIPTGSEFCERVAEILGIEKPVFGKSLDEMLSENCHIQQIIDENSGPTFAEIDEALKGDPKDMPFNYPHRTYRVLDSLDGIPLDKRIALSEWIPPIGVDVNFIHNGDFGRGQIQCIDKHGIIVKWRGLACVFESDGHWMRIV